MTLYYERGGVTIYCDRAENVLPTIQADVFLTDPPYGIRWKRGQNNARSSRRHAGIQNDEDTTARDAILAMLGDKPGVVFGSFYAPYPAQVRQVLVWAKPADAGVVGATTGFRRDAEPIFLVGRWPTKTIRWSSVLHVRAGQHGTCTATGHPHTKPVALLMRLIEALPAGVIVDPFMGAGSTLVAAKLLGRSAIGIEIDERWCQVAVRRLAQEVLPLEMPA